MLFPCINVVVPYFYQIQRTLSRGESLTTLALQAGVLATYPQWRAEGQKVAWTGICLVSRASLVHQAYLQFHLFSQESTGGKRNLRGW